MATIVVFGGTGYTGGSVVREAAARDHHVISVSRSEHQEPVDGVRYEVGSDGKVKMIHAGDPSIQLVEGRA